ncbi:hypothetical protein ACWFNE_20595 [Cellulomonas sp. NPDC055163]
MRIGFDIYRVGPDQDHQEPASSWGWTPRRGEVPTGETVVQDHDFALTYTGTDSELAAAFGRGAKLMEIVRLWPELSFYPSTAGDTLPDGSVFPVRGEGRPTSALSALRGRFGRRSAGAQAARAATQP